MTRRRQHQHPPPWVMQPPLGDANAAASAAYCRIPCCSHRNKLARLAALNPRTKPQRALYALDAGRPALPLHRPDPSSSQVPGTATPAPPLWAMPPAPNPCTDTIAAASATCCRIVSGFFTCSHRNKLARLAARNPRTKPQRALYAPDAGRPVLPLHRPVPSSSQVPWRCSSQLWDFDSAEFHRRLPSCAHRDQATHPFFAERRTHYLEICQKCKMILQEWPSQVALQYPASQT